MHKLVAALLVLATPVVLHAQSSVHGTVVDQQSGSPIAGATITAPDTTVRTMTDATGAFTLNATGAIDHVTVSAAGYVTKDVPVSNPATALRIRLTVAPVQLAGVQVVANSPNPSTAVLTSHDLDRSSGLSLQSSINAVPGVFMQTRTPWGGARITIRGYYPSTSGNSPNSNGLGYQVFFNNIPITDATGSTVLDDIDYSTLGSVEVIKGPASSLYGSYVGGTVLLNTARPTPNETSVGQQVVSGTNGLVRTNTSFETAGESGDVALNYGHQDYDSFRPHSGSTKDYFRATGDMVVNTNQTLSAYFSYNKSFEELAGEIDSTPFYARIAQSNPAYLANNSHIRVNSFLSGLTDQIRLGESFTNQTTVFGVGRQSGQPFAHGFTDVNQYDFGARTQFGFSGQLGAGTGVGGTLGASVQQSNLTSNGVFIIPAPPFPERPTDQENAATATSLFTEWSFALPQAFTITAGASLNKNQFNIRNLLNAGTLFDTTQVSSETFGWEFDPRIAVSKEIHGSALVYASVSAGYAPPLLSNVVASDGTVDLNLKPERAVQYEVGTQGNFFDRRLTGQLSLFDIENSDKLVTETADAVTFTTNAGKQRNRGVEVSLSYLAVSDTTRPISTVRPWASYSFTDATFTDFKSDNNNNAQTVDFSGNDVPRVPRNVVNVGLDLASNVGLYLNGSYQYVSKVPVTFDNSTWVRSYDLLGLKVGYKKDVNKHWLLDLAVGGDNLTGSTYYSFLFVGANINALAQAEDGGRGDGYIIPAPYKAQLYSNISLRYVF
ncbi:MAG TPA: TonB-dependent receptor [Gemmatimonadaceae bacterium]|jgi:iron complex outermembrane receptor protein